MSNGWRLSSRRSAPASPRSPIARIRASACWTPGPLNETYFEQAYLARYLGFILVEGGDLTVREGKVHVRTIAGLKRADVIWRRIDSDFADPLELNGQSRLGVAGLVEAVREGGVALANALGSGVLEAPAMMSFMPKLCRKIMGEDLRLPNIATWWCGQQAERASVIADMDNLAIGGAFGNPVLRFPQHQPVIAGLLTADEKARLISAIGERGIDYVGQEVVNLSTTPVWNDDRLTPRPFVLRVYAARTQNGWTIMPGGFCRISDRADARAVSMGAGVQSADVWVLADKPVEMITLLPTNETARIRRLMGNLPSRAADNLFWLGRYLERVEATLRLDPLSRRPHDQHRRRNRNHRLDGLQGHWPPHRMACGAEDGRRRSAGALRHRAAQRGKLRIRPVARARRAPRRLGHPRAAFGRHLAADRRTRPELSAPTRSRCSAKPTPMTRSTRRCAPSPRSPASRRKT